MTDPRPVLGADYWAWVTGGEEIQLSAFLTAAPPFEAALYSPTLHAVIFTDTCDMESVRIDGSEAPAAIALLNDVLPDDDPAKITHRMLRVLYEAVDGLDVDTETQTDVRAIVAALTRYLRPA